MWVPGGRVAVFGAAHTCSKPARALHPHQREFSSVAGSGDDGSGSGAPDDEAAGSPAVSSTPDVRTTPLSEQPSQEDDAAGVDAAERSEPEARAGMEATDPVGAAGTAGALDASATPTAPAAPARANEPHDSAQPGHGDVGSGSGTPPSPDSNVVGLPPKDRANPKKPTKQADDAIAADIAEHVRRLRKKLVAETELIAEPNVHHLMAVTMYILGVERVADEATFVQTLRDKPGALRTAWKTLEVIVARSRAFEPPLAWTDFLTEVRLSHEAARCCYGLHEVMLRPGAQAANSCHFCTPVTPACKRSGEHGARQTPKRLLRASEGAARVVSRILRHCMLCTLPRASRAHAVRAGGPRQVPGLPHR